MAVVLLETAVQEYAWGCLGGSSSVARFKHAQNARLGVPFCVLSERPYAELWVGTHPSGPSRTSPEGALLSEVLARDPVSLLGEPTLRLFPESRSSLPFLLKILSVRQALSIQAHPDKALAQRLFATRPDLYKDPNHKPEMALALSRFEMLCGFRSVSEIGRFLKQVPEMTDLIGAEVVGQFERAKETSAVALKIIFSALMTAEETAVKQHVAALVARLNRQEKKSELEEGVLRIHADYPGDVGVFCPFVLNHFWLQPGEAVFLGPNEPHAYLSGECVECMATSDNVVRAGLTPKLRDCKTLIEMLTYQERQPGGMRGEKKIAGVTSYVPPVPDFQVELCESRGRLSLPSHSSACLGIVTEGSGTVGGIDVVAGSCFFVPFGTPLEVLGDVTLYLASVNL